MPRAPTILQSDFPYSISGRCINKEWFHMPMPEVWDVMSRHLYFLHRAYNFRIHAFVLMTNHYHLLASTPDANLSSGMRCFMQSTSSEITKSTNRINQTYGGRHFRSVIEKTQYYLHAYKYIYRNPVEAKLCSNVEDYPYSTLHGLHGKSRLVIPVVEDTTLFNNFEQTMKWLNTPIEPKNKLAVRNALMKSRFKLAKDPNTKKAAALELDML